MDERHARKASLILALFINVADWIASDPEAVPFGSTELDLEAYWQETQACARAAVTRTGLLPIEPKHDISFSTIYPEITTPSPLQGCAIRYRSMAGPCW